MNKNESRWELKEWKNEQEGGRGKQEEGRIKENAGVGGRGKEERDGIEKMRV